MTKIPSPKKATPKKRIPKLDLHEMEEEQVKELAEGAPLDVTDTGTISDEDNEHKIKLDAIAQGVLDALGIEIKDFESMVEESRKYYWRGVYTQLIGEKKDVEVQGGLVFMAEDGTYVPLSQIKMGVALGVGIGLHPERDSMMWALYCASFYKLAKGDDPMLLAIRGILAGMYKTNNILNELAKKYNIFQNMHVFGQLRPETVAKKRKRVH